jgi:uncharacterized protein
VTPEYSSLGRSASHNAEIAVRAAGQAITLPLLIARGSRGGPVLVLSAGVHGDEYEGIQTIFDLFCQIDPGRLRGDLIALALANPPAFQAGTRSSPLDGCNLARVFPGDAGGSPTEAIAHAIDTELLARADFYLDLHSGGVACEMPVLVGYHQADLKARDAAGVLGMPVVWCHPTVAPGRTVSSAIGRGVPSLYFEAPGGGRVNAAGLTVYRRGVLNLMRHLGMLDEPLEAAPAPLRLHGDGNIDSSLSATGDGFLTPRVDLLQRVSTGALLGTLHDPWGREIDRFIAPCSGVVVMIHSFRLVRSGEPLFLITEVRP